MKVKVERRQSSSGCRFVVRSECREEREREGEERKGRNAQRSDPESLQRPDAPVTTRFVPGPFVLSRCSLASVTTLWSFPAVSCWLREAVMLRVERQSS